MEITSIGIQGLHQAREKLNAAGRKLVEEGPDADHIIDLKEAQRSAEVATKVLEVGHDVEASLLDILA